MNTEYTLQLDKNIQWMRQYMPAVLRQVQAEPGCAIVLEEDMDVDWNCRIHMQSGKQFWLHSTVDREREYRMLAEQIQPEHNTLVLFGCGSADLLRYLAEQCPQVKHLILVEPNPTVFLSFLKKWEIQSALSVFPQVSLVINEPQESVGEKVRKIMAQGTLESKIVALISLVNYKWNFQNYERGIYAGLAEALRYNRLNFNTVNAFAVLWTINFWQNLRFGDAEIRDFADTFEEKPAIVVAAGPSLDKNIHLIEQAKEKAIIVAVGSAITILENKGIKPHFRVAIDPTRENEALFEKIGEDEVPLIYTNHLFYKILSRYHGPKVNMSLKSNSGIEEYLYNKAGQERVMLDSGFSVANVALNLLLYWKCDPVVFVGQDLGYTQDRLHAEGSWDSGVEEQFIKKKFLRQDIWGNEIYTDNAFEGMRMVFESIIAKNQQTHFYNATEGGIAIAGAPNIMLKELLAQWETYEFSVEQVINEKISSNIRQEDYQMRRQAVRDAIEILKKDINDFFKLAKKTARYAKELLERTQPPTDKEARRIVRLLREVQSHIIYKTVGSVFDEFFRLRRDGYLQKQEQKTTVLPQVRLLYLEVNDILIYWEKVKTLIQHYEDGIECKVIFE